jgi:RNA polymerase sigma-70 factor (ECF subfamily)
MAIGSQSFFHIPLARWWNWRYLLAIGDSTPRQPSTSTNLVANFESFVHTYERLILNYLWRMTGEEQSAYDLTQETFLRAWTHFAQISQYDNPRAWLLKVATNLALTFRARRNAPVGATILLDETNEPWASDPGRHIAESEMVRSILQALAPKQRALLVLRELYGLSLDELANTLSMTRDAVKMALCRAREQFRTLYEREEHQP